jgi:hypothetical protein
MVSISMIDTITVVFQDELETLKTQAQSLAVYGGNLGTIFVVINEDTGLGSKIDRSWWGRFQECVQVVSRQAFGDVWCNNGWVSQQVLKLITSTISGNEWSIILDAKTFFVNPMPSLDSKPAVGKLPVFSVFDPSRQIVNNLFNIDLDDMLGPGGVPFVINNQQTREMVNWIEWHTQQPFVEWFQNQGMLTEFILYSGWIQYKFGSFDSIYNTAVSAMIPCNVCHSEVPMFDTKFAQMPQATTVSIHRRAWTQLTAQQQTQYQEFLYNRGIQ